MGAAERASGLVVFGAEQTPKNGLDAKHMKKIPVYADTICVTHLPARSQIESLVGRDREFGDTLLALAVLLPHGKSDLGILARKLAGSPVAIGDAYGAQLSGILDRNGAQADRVDQLEDCGVCADAKG